LPKLRPVPWRELVRRLRELGYDGPFWGAKHPFMTRGEVMLTVPNPHGDDIGVGLLAGVLREAGISRDEWLGRRRA